MKINPWVSSEELKKLNIVKTKEEPRASLEGVNLRSGPVCVMGPTPALRPTLIGLSPLTGDPVSARDELYLKTASAVACLDPSESVNVFVEELIMSLPKEAISKGQVSRLDENVCRLRGFYADLQRPAVLAKIGKTYDEYKKIIASEIELMAKDCREYVAKTVNTARTMQTGLEANDAAAVQSYNHLSRVISTLFTLPVEDGMVYLDDAMRPSQSLDDDEHGATNRQYEALAYSGGRRDTFMKYYPYLLLSSHGPIFLQALSHPRQLAAVVTRPGPLNLPPSTAAQLGLPAGLKVTHRSVSRLGESYHWGDKLPSGIKTTAPVLQYYTYEDGGVTKVLALDKRVSWFIQKENRLPLEIPPGVFRNTIPVKAIYIMHDKKRLKTGLPYKYKVGNREEFVNQATHQKILQHNIALHPITPGAPANPNVPVHYTHPTQGSLDSILNKLLNPLAAKSATNKSEAINLLRAAGYADRMLLIKELSGILGAKFEAKQKKVEDLRAILFADFADNKIAKDEVEDRCRKEAKLAFRELVGELRTFSIPEAHGRNLITQNVATIEGKFDDMYTSKESAFAEMVAARSLFLAGVQPFAGVFDKYTKEHSNYLNVSSALENVSQADRAVFDALKLKSVEQLRSPGGFRDQLRGAYWGGVTQHMMDISFGPEGIYKDGPYISREGLPKTGKEFVAYIAANGKELLSDPIQVANRLSKNYAHFEYNVSPYHAIPWPNLYRKNDLMDKTKKVVRPGDKPAEPPVVIKINMEVMTDAGVKNVSVPVNHFKLKNPREDMTSDPDNVLLGTSLSDVSQAKVLELS